MVGYKRIGLAGLLLTVAIVPSGCGRPKPVPADSQAAQHPDPVPHSREADDVARFLAGIPGNTGSPFTPLEQTKAWKDHRDQLDHAWQSAEGKLIAGLHDFQKTELDDPALKNATVFYPFSGPDTVMATTCFPQSASYVLVALEPAGTLPSFAQIEKKDLAKYLAAMRETMASVLGRSFFITRQMDREFRGQVTDGLLLPILQTLVRRHYTILGFRYVRLDETGHLIARDVSYKAPTIYGNKGLEIEFRSDADQSVHQLRYLSVNLSDERLRENKPFLTYAAGLKGTATLLKATSYMTHHRDFSLIRDLLLSNSAAVLQDDSGIPFHFFRPELWKVQLYGEYARPYGSFKWLVQPDLQKAFKAEGTKTLPLRIGYGYGKVASNLLLARRSTPTSAMPGTAQN